MALGHLSWVTCLGITGRDHWAGSLGGITGDFEGGNPCYHWAESLGGITGNLEGGEPMGSLCGIAGRDHKGGSLGGITGRELGGITGIFEGG